MKTFEEFVDILAREQDVSYETAKLQVLYRLGEAHISVKHAVWYINFPEMTEAEIAEEAGVTQQAVNQALARLRQKFRSTRLDATGFQGDVSLIRMKRIYPGSEHIDRDKVIRF